MISGCDNKARLADVLFIHGLRGDAFGTWRHDDEEQGFWPHWLGEDFPNVGIWSLEYPAAATKWARPLGWFFSNRRDAGHAMPLPDRAADVLDLLAQHGLGQRPLMLVCHSLGGLLGMRILKQSFDFKVTEEKRSVFESARAALFLASPHHGSLLADLLHFLRLALAGPPVDDLRSDNAYQYELLNWFRQNADGIKIRSFVETRRVGPLKIVSRASADLGVGDAAVPIDEDHVSIAKPRDRTARVYASASAMLQQLLASQPRLTLLDEVNQMSQLTSRALVPDVLPLVKRDVVDKALIPALCRSLEATGKGQIIAVTGPAGYGKSTLLGDLYARLTDQLGGKAGWVSLMRGADISTRLKEEELQKSLGYFSCGRPAGIVEVVRKLTEQYGRGVLLIDTLDLIIDVQNLPVLRVLLMHLTAEGVTVLVTCRDVEFQAYLANDVAVAAHVHSVEGFSREEVREAAQGFVRMNPQLFSGEGGAGFVDDIVDAAVDHRPLRDIIHSPLLLALACQLYGPRGKVPRTLTIGQLYDEVWRGKVASDRLSGEGTAEAMAMERVCLRVARVVVEQSKERLHEAFTLNDLAFPGEAPVSLALLAQAVRNLSSNGILKKVTHGGYRFFHQTFLEYAIARYFQTREGDGQRNQVLAALSDPFSAPASFHILPVVRNLLVMEESDDAFDQLARTLVGSGLQGFRVEAYAVMAREKAARIPGLVLRAMKAGLEHEAALLDALKSAPVSLNPEVWKAYCDLIRQAHWRPALHGAEAVGRFYRRHATQFGAAWADAIAAVQARNDDQVTPLLAELLKPWLETDESVPPAGLEVLQAKFATFDPAIQATVVRLHLAGSVPQEMRLRLVQQLLQGRISRAVRQVVQELMEQLLPELIDGQQGLWPSPLAALHASLPKGWALVQARMIGRRLANDPESIRELTCLLVMGPREQISAHLIAIREGITNHGGDAVYDALIAIPPDAITVDRVTAVRDVIIRLYPVLDDTAQRRLFDWAADVFEKDVSLSHVILARYLVEGGVERIPPDWLSGLKPSSQIGYLRRALGVSAGVMSEEKALQIKEQFSLAGASQVEVRKLEAVLLGLTGENTPGAIDRLVTLCFDGIDAVSALAAHSLWRLVKAQRGVELARLSSMTAAPAWYVREVWLNCVIEYHFQKRHVPLEILQHLCDTFEHGENEALRHRMLEFVPTWIRWNQCAPTGVFHMAKRVLQRFISGTITADDVLRLLLILLKVLAQHDRWLIPGVRAAMLETLEKAPISRQNVVAAFDAFHALHQLDPTFLEAAVALGDRIQPENLRPLARAVNESLGSKSILLRRIAELPQCTDEVKDMVVKYQTTHK